MAIENFVISFLLTFLFWEKERGATGKNEGSSVSFSSFFS